MTDEDREEFKRKQRESGQTTSVEHPATSTGSPAEASTYPWKMFLEDMEGGLPGIVYYRDSNGQIKRHWLVNSSGVQTVTEASAAAISGYVGALSYHIDLDEGHQSINAGMYGESSTTLVNKHHRIGRAVITVAGGAAANVSLVPANASAYYGVCKIGKIWSSTNEVAGANTLTGRVKYAELQP